MLWLSLIHISTETPSENPGEDSSNKPASVEAPVTKEDGSVFKMFVISERCV